ncbi:MAG: HNH endonuclease [Patescibacteria group bacterium]|jgi:hypothetical protein
MICTGVCEKEFLGDVFKIEYNCKKITVFLKRYKGLHVELVRENRGLYTDCWELCNRALWDGYGRIKHKQRMYKAHRFLFSFFSGIDIDSFSGKLLNHQCDNRKCCNPYHLLIGTHTDNMNERSERNRCACGVQNAAHILTEEDVLYILGSEMIDEYLAGVLGVVEETIKRVRKRETWKHVEVEEKVCGIDVDIL